MKPKHYLLLIIGSVFTVSGIYLDLKDSESDADGFIKAIGIGTLLAFIITFYKHLKSKNETTSK